MLRLLFMSPWQPGEVRGNTYIKIEVYFELVLNDDDMLTTPYWPSLLKLSKPSTDRIKGERSRVRDSKANSEVLRGLSIAGKRENSNGNTTTPTIFHCITCQAHLSLILDEAVISHTPSLLPEKCGPVLEAFAHTHSHKLTHISSSSSSCACVFKSPFAWPLPHSEAAHFPSLIGPHRFSSSFLIG